MTTLVDLKRKVYMRIGGTTRRPIPSYLSAKYKNIRQELTAETTYIVTQSDVANSPGIAFNVYGDRFYWWVICHV